jgi:thioredoxin 1
MEATQVSGSDFTSQVLQSDLPVMVDFFAVWCPPCQILGPTIDGLAEEFADRVRVLKVNVDLDPQLMRLYGIMSIPTLVFFRKGQVVARLVGAASVREIRRTLEELTRSASN